MDMFLATFGILGWGTAIATALWFRSETARLADELRLALLFIGSLKQQVARYEQAASNLMGRAPAPPPRPDAILRSHIIGDIPPATKG